MSCYENKTFLEMTFLDTRKNISIGYGSVGRAVASNSRGQQFESSHRKNVYTNIYCQLFWKDKNKEKEAWNGPFLKEISALHKLIGSGSEV